MKSRTKNILTIIFISIIYSDGFISNTLTKPRKTVILNHRKSNKKTPYKTAMTPGGFGTAGEPPIEIRGFSLSNLFLTFGFLSILSSFANYLTNTDSITSIGFVIGLPILLVGSALKYGEIEPVIIKTDDEASVLFDVKKTDTMSKIKNDVTRHRYGDEAHLDSTLKSLGLVIPSKPYPQLKYLQYGISDNNELEFMMVWQSLYVPFRIWNEIERINKYDTYFGPGIWSKVIKVDSKQRLVGIKLTTGERPESEKKDVPLGVWKFAPCIDNENGSINYYNL